MDLCLKATETMISDFKIECLFIPCDGFWAILPTKSHKKSPPKKDTVVMQWALQSPKMKLLSRSFPLS